MPSVNAAELTVRINTELNDRGLVDADRRVEETTSRWKTVLGTAGGFLLANAVQAVVGNIGQLAQAGLTFEANMANVNSIMQLTSSELDALSQQVLELTNNPGITQGPAELAEGLYNIASSGFEGADGLQVLEVAAIAATAGLTTADTAAMAVTAALNAYGLGADQARAISDMMFQTVNDGVISFDQLATNMGNVLPIAASLGVEFAEVGAAYAQMTLQGVGASQAETQIAALMRAALNPTQALTDAVVAHGYANAQAAIESEGLAGFLAILTEEAGGSGEALFDMLGTQEAVNAALLLGGENAAAYVEEVARMEAATEGAGATQEALAKQMESASFAIAKMRQQVEVAATVFMGILAPAITFAANAVTSFLTGAVVPLINALGNLGSGGGLFGGLRGIFDDVKTLFSSPLSLFGIDSLDGNQIGRDIAEAVLPESAIEFFDSKAASLQIAMQGIANALDPRKVFRNSKAAEFNQWIDEAFSIDLRRLGEIEKVFIRLGQAINIVTGLDVVTWMGEVGRGLDRFPRAFQKITRQVSQLARIFTSRGLMAGFRAMFGKQGLDIVTGFGDAFAALPKLAGAAIRNITTGIAPLDRVLRNLGSTFTSLGRLVQEVFQGDFEGAAEVINRLGDQFIRLGESVLDGIVEGLRAVPWGTVWEGVVSLLTGAAGALGTLAGAVAGSLISVASSILGGVISGVQNTDWSSVWTEVTTFIGNAIPAVLETGKDVALSFIARLAEGIFPGGFGTWIRSQLGLTSGTDAQGNKQVGADVAGIPMGDLFLQYVAQLAGDVWSGLGSFAAWAKDKIGDISGEVVNLGSALVEFFINAGPAVIGWVSANAGTVAAWVRSGWDGALDIGSAVVNFFVNAGENVIGWMNAHEGTVAAWLRAGWDNVVDIANVAVRASISPVTGTPTPEAEASFRENTRTLLEGILNPVPVEVSPEFTVSVKTGSQTLTEFLLGGGGLKVDTARIQQAVLPSIAAVFSPAALLGMISSRFAVGRFGPAIGDILAAAFAGASGPVIGAIADLGDAIGKDLGRLQDVVRNGLNTAAVAMRIGWNSLKDAVSGGIDWLTGPIDSIVGAVEGMVAPIQAAYDAIKPILDFLLGGGGGGGTGGVEADPQGSTGGGFSGGAGGAGGIGGLDVGRRRAPLQLPGNVRQEPMVIPAPDTSAFDAAMARIPTTVGTHMSAALGAANAYATGIGTAVGSAIGAMVGNVGALMGAFVTTVGGQMSAALGAASTYSTAIYSVVSSQIGSLVGNTAALMGAFVTAIGGAMSTALGVAATYSAAMASVIQSNLAGAAAAAYSSGLAIGQGLAAGMNATLGMVQAAAAALASAAATAAAARLAIASPSKVFTRMGEQVGDGFVIGIQSRYGAAGRAGTGLAGSSIPSIASAAAAGGRGRYGDQRPIVIQALKSDELVRLLEKAERGGRFAELLPQLLRQGAY